MLEEALLPFLAGFPTSRLKLITMYIEQRRVKDSHAVAAAAAAANGSTAGFVRVKPEGSGEVGGRPRLANKQEYNKLTRFTPIR